MSDSQRETDTDITGRLSSASPFELVSIARCLAEIFNLSREELVVSPEASGAGHYPHLAAALQSLSAEASGIGGQSKTLAPDEAVEFARLILQVAAADTLLHPYVAGAITRFDADESMNAIEVLARGVAWSLIIIVATTRLEIEPGQPTRIVKEALDGQAIVKLLEIFRGR